MNLDERLKKLRHVIKETGSLLVAFSGGVDSSIIAKIAHEELGNKSVAVTIDSDTFSQRELEISQQIAKEIGITHRIIKASELTDYNFVQNRADRCYFCKKEEIRGLKVIAAQYGYKHIAFGVNVSDFGEHRPGIQALNEEGFSQPLVEAGVGKDIMASLAKKIGLSNYNLPSTTCLASRIPYGNPITAEKLIQVERAESFLYSLGISQSRVRNYGDLARIEVFEHEIDRVVENRKAILSRLKDAGFTYVTLDLEGYRSGSMNEVL